MFARQKINFEQKLKELRPVYSFPDKWLPQQNSTLYWCQQSNLISREVLNQIDMDFARSLIEVITKAFYSVDTSSIVDGYEDLLADLVKMNIDWEGVTEPRDCRVKWLNCNSREGVIREIIAMASALGGSHIDLMVDILEDDLYSILK